MYKWLSKFKLIQLYKSTQFIEGCLENDSKIHFGWLNDIEVFLIPQLTVNHGRYLNSSRSPNVVASWRMYDDNGSHRPILLLVTCKDVQKKDQLFWNYGEYFFNH